MAIMSVLESIFHLVSLVLVAYPELHRVRLQKQLIWINVSQDYVHSCIRDLSPACVSYDKLHLTGPSRKAELRLML